MVLRGRQRRSDLAATEGRLQARPGRVTRTAATGLLGLRGGDGRTGVIYVPASYNHHRPLPLVLMLHGAGAEGLSGLRILQALADSEGLILLAPDSRGPTWDLILGDYGPDVLSIDQALTWLFGEYAVDPGHVVISGFSDGASYALSLGVTNGDLFTHIAAFSPGFMLPGKLHGRPRIFVSHGTADAVLPIERCSRRLVPQLRREGYEVDYQEFDGPHTVPPEIALEAVRWLLRPQASATNDGP